MRPFPSDPASDKQFESNRMEALAEQMGWLVSPEQETTESAQEHSLSRHGSSSNGLVTKDSLVMTNTTLNKQLPWVLPPLPKKVDCNQELGERTVYVVNSLLPVAAKQ